MYKQTIQYSVLVLLIVLRNSLLINSGDVDLSISFDNLKWFSYPEPFYFYEVPAFVSINPSSKLRLAHTAVSLNGVGFFESDTLSCRFSFPLCGGGSFYYPATYMSSSMIQCNGSPVYVACNNVVIELAFNGVQYYQATDSFAYINVPKLYHITPPYSLLSCTLLVETYSFS